MKRALLPVLAVVVGTHCTPLPSDLLQGLVVRVTTVGGSQDPDGYTVIVDGTDSQSIGQNGAVTFAGLAAGDHTVELSGLAGNCGLPQSDPNPRTVTVTEGSVVEATFTVICNGTGQLVVRATTTGSSLDADGYVVTVDGDAATMQSIGPSGSVVFGDLVAGEHTVTLAGVAANCVVEGTNQQTITVAESGLVEASFSVRCTGAGSVLVRATTTGSSLDPDGYSVTVDGDVALRKTIAPNGAVAFEGLSAGEHVVALDGVAANCSVAEPTSRLVTVAEGGVVEVPFVVTCAGTGWLLVRAVTTGSGVDIDGYRVTVDADPELEKAVGPNGSAAFDGLSAGEHLVALSGVASNCHVDGPGAHVVSVVEGGVAEVAFAIRCLSGGGLIVAATTIGSSLDVDGYTVSVDGDEDLAQTVGPNGSVSFVGLAAGEHSVALGGVADNCAMTGPNPRTVTVAADATVLETYHVTCAGSGDIVVGATTTGSDLDSDGFMATVDGDASRSQVIGPNGSVLFSGLTPGDHSVELSDVAANCTVMAPNPRSVTVAEDATVHTVFRVNCEPPDPPTPPETGSLEVEVMTTGSHVDQDGYVVTVDRDDDLKKAIVTNGTVFFDDVEIGDHLVELSGIATNCTVTSQNPRVVTVAADATVHTVFLVNCEAPDPPPPPETGSLEVVVTTTGSHPDQDGYKVVLDDDYDLRKFIGPNGTVLFEDLAVGDHWVKLSRIADNCAVHGPNPQTVWVEGGETARVTFEVVCTASAMQ